LYFNTFKNRRKITLLLTLTNVALLWVANVEVRVTVQLNSRVRVKGNSLL